MVHHAPGALRLMFSLPPPGADPLPDPSIFGVLCASCYTPVQASPHTLLLKRLDSKALRLISSPLSFFIFCFIHPGCCISCYFLSLNRNLYFKGQCWIPAGPSRRPDVPRVFPVLPRLPWPSCVPQEESVVTFTPIFLLMESFRIDFSPLVSFQRLKLSRVENEVTSKKKLNSVIWNC